MKNILKFGLVLLLLLSVLVIGVGCDKMSGGGWFLDMDSGNKITVGFNAQALDEYYSEPDEVLQAKGQFQLIDHGTKDRIHCEFVATGEGDMDGKPWVSFFGGPATLNGEGGYVAGVEFHDNVDYGQSGKGDLVTVVLLDAENPDFNNPVRSYGGFLSGGNARQHEPK